MFIKWQHRLQTRYKHMSATLTQILVQCCIYTVSRVSTQYLPSPGSGRWRQQRPAAALAPPPSLDPGHILPETFKLATITSVTYQKNGCIFLSLLSTGSKWMTQTHHPTRENPSSLQILNVIIF